MVSNLETLVNTCIADWDRETYLYEATEGQVVYLVLVAIPRKVAFDASRAPHEKDIGFSSSRPIEDRLISSDDHVTSYSVLTYISLTCCRRFKESLVQPHLHNTDPLFNAPHLHRRIL
jgi:hypothetical protein